MAKECLYVSALQNGNVIEYLSGLRKLFTRINNDEYFVWLNGSCKGDVTKVGYYDNHDLRIIRAYSDYRCSEIIWEQNPLINDIELEILKSIPSEYIYITRDLDGRLYIHTSEPIGVFDYNTQRYVGYRCKKISKRFDYDEYFKFIKFMDDGKYIIRYLINEYFEPKLHHR